MFVRLVCQCPPRTYHTRGMNTRNPTPNPCTGTGLGGAGCVRGVFRKRAAVRVHTACAGGTPQGPYPNPLTITLWHELRIARGLVCYTRQRVLLAPASPSWYTPRMSNVYRPKISPLFPKSASFLAPPLRYTQQNGVYEPEERTETLEFHADPPFAEKPTVPTSASSFEALVDLCRRLNVLRRLVSTDSPPISWLPSPFALPSPTHLYTVHHTRKLLADILSTGNAPAGSDDRFHWPEFNPADPYAGVKGWRYGTSEMLPDLAYRLCEGTVMCDTLKNLPADGSHSADVTALPCVPRLMRRDPGGKAFIQESSRLGSGEWTPCLAGPHWVDEELNPSPGGDIDLSSQPPSATVSAAFSLDPNSRQVAEVPDGGYDSDLFRRDGYPLVDPPAGSDDGRRSVAAFHLDFPSRVLPMLCARFAKALGNVGCVYGGTLSGRLDRSLAFEPVRRRDDGVPVDWPPNYVTVTGSPSTATPVTDANPDLCYCAMIRPGCSGGQGLGCFSEESTEAELAIALNATSRFRDVPPDSAACVRAGDAAVLAKCPGWERLRLCGFLQATAWYEVVGERDYSGEELCSHEGVYTHDRATAYVPVTLAPSPSLTASDGSGKVVWLVDGSLAALKQAALSALTGPGGLRNTPHFALQPPAIATARKYTGPGYEGSNCYYTTDPKLRSEFYLSGGIVCPRVVVPKSFFSPVGP